MQVKDVMSTEIETIGRNDDLSMLQEVMHDKQLRHIPVVENGELVGVVTQRDLFKATMSSAMGFGEKAQKAYLHSVRVKEIMVYPVVSVTPETSLHEAIDLMLQKGIGCLPVTNGSELAGIITKTDLLRYLRNVE